MDSTDDNKPLSDNLIDHSDHDNESNDDDNNSNENEPSTTTKSKPHKKVLNIEKRKCCKRGIVYLNYIPEGITVKNLREILSKYGDIERIYLEKDSSLKKTKRSKKFVRYTEGWIEFRKKSVAKMVAEMLNGTQIGGKRHTKYHDALWNIKYLKRFKWNHLAEQMAYEKALRDQKLRLEIGRAKREATFYAEMIERNRNKKQIYNDNNRTYKQRQTEQQIKQHKPNADELDEELLEKIFK